MADEPPASRPTSAVPSSTASNDNFQEATATAAGEETATTGSTTASKAEAEVDEGDAGASKEAQEDEKAPEVPPKRLSLAHEPENAPPTPPIMVKNLDEDTTSPLHTAAESKPRASLEVPVPGRHSSKGRDDDESGRRSRRSTDPEGMLVETLRGQIDELHNQVTQLNSKVPWVPLHVQCGAECLCTVAARQVVRSHSRARGRAPCHQGGARCDF